MNNKTEVTSVKLVLFKYVMSFETLTKVDQLTEILRFWLSFKTNIRQLVFRGEPYNLWKLIHFCQGVQWHHILKQDELDTSDLSLVSI